MHSVRAAVRLSGPAPATPATATDSVDEADRRQVTVLFADLTGFTSLAEHLETPETLRSFQNALFATMAEAITRYDGFVEKFVGDAVLAVFGAPHAHEDDPLRALKAAQDMLQDVNDLGLQWTTRLGRAVTLHRRHRRSGCRAPRQRRRRGLRGHRRHGKRRFETARSC